MDFTVLSGRIIMLLFSGNVEGEHPSSVFLETSVPHWMSSRAVPPQSATCALQSLHMGKLDGYLQDCSTNVIYAVCMHIDRLFYSSTTQHTSYFL